MDRRLFLRRVGIRAAYKLGMFNAQEILGTNHALRNAVDSFGSAKQRTYCSCLWTRYFRRRVFCIIPTTLRNCTVVWTAAQPLATDARATNPNRSGCPTTNPQQIEVVDLRLQLTDV